MKTKIQYVFILILGLGLSSCSSDDNSEETNRNQSDNVSISLPDGEIISFNLSEVDVQISYSPGNGKYTLYTLGSSDIIVDDNTISYIEVSLGEASSLSDDSNIGCGFCGINVNGVSYSLDGALSSVDVESVSHNPDNACEDEVRAVYTHVFTDSDNGIAVMTISVDEDTMIFDTRGC